MDHKKEMLQTIREQADLFEIHCKTCDIKAAITAAGHGRGSVEDYCNIICPVGKRLRKIGIKLTDLRALGRKSLELTKSNMRALLEDQLNNEQMAQIFDTSASTIARRKREWGLVLKNYNAGYSLADYKKALAFGFTDAEICAKWNIGKRTLSRWKKDKWGII